VSVHSTTVNLLEIYKYTTVAQRTGSNSYNNPSWGWSFYRLVSLWYQCAKPHAREGYNYYINCHLGNITVEER